jgi:putative ATPase
VQSQANIFQSDTEFQEPLAHRMRPNNIDELVGSIKNNPAFLNWLSKGVKQSAIFWGPPGTGKTSIAQLASKYSDKEFIKLQAFSSGVKDLREVISRAEKIPGKIILFVDEVHSFNKSQQDILLNAIERGIISFIGATTENPAVSINRALLSRILKFELKPHCYKDLEELTKRALHIESKEMDANAIDYLIKASYGDARHLLTSLELLINNAGTSIDLKLTQEIINKKLFAGDPNSYYDCVSALQKSLRGSDVDASLYWLARLLTGGAELESVARRILVTAAEDIGIADPQALILADAAYSAVLKLGMPEARIPLATAVVYLAKAPKSNHAYKALDKAMNDCRNHPPYAIPEHLRNIHLDSGPSLNSCPAKSNNERINPITKYKYPHDYPGAWVEQQYLPDELINKKFFCD